ncbi:MAG: sel1 repeat family protein [Gammaproteobacteria bacterium]|nr:sel1 repeat family protein [Gammaproteobacteria bacterium]
MLRILFLIAFNISLSACSNFSQPGAAITEQQLAGHETLSIDTLTVKVTEQGDLTATMELARRYALGDGVEQNGETALRLYQVVIKSDYDYNVLSGYTAIAQTRIGRLYLDGVSPIKQDFIEAFLWFDRVINRHGQHVSVDNEAVLRYHNFARLNMTDAERVELKRRLKQSP